MNNYHSSNRSCCPQNDNSRLTHKHKVTYLFPLSLVKNLLITLTIFRACLVLLHNNNVIKFNLFTAFPWTKLFHYIGYCFVSFILFYNFLGWKYYDSTCQNKNVPISGEKKWPPESKLLLSYMNWLFLTWYRILNSVE